VLGRVGEVVDRPVVRNGPISTTPTRWRAAHTDPISSMPRRSCGDRATTARSTDDSNGQSSRCSTPRHGPPERSLHVVTVWPSPVNEACTVLASSGWLATNRILMRTFERNHPLSGQGTRSRIGRVEPDGGSRA
jgi:hypothetical protein